MILTNKKNLPQAFVMAVSTDPHNADGEYSATTLNKGTKEILLTRRHWKNLTDDVANRIWAVWGAAVHLLFEAQKDNCFHEEKFRVPVSRSVVTGQVDSYDMERGIINDWKTASVWKVQVGDFADWHAQGMTYAWLMTQSGLEVKKCQFIALLKDHSKSKARNDSQYPQSPVYIYEFDITEQALVTTGAKIEAKIKEIEDAESISDDEIVPCTAEERWADNDKWAVMKNGRKTAIKLFDDNTTADACAVELGNGYFVEHRPAISRKCMDYCMCKEFCSFYKNEVAK